MIVMFLDFSRLNMKPVYELVVLKGKGEAFFCLSTY